MNRPTLSTDQWAAASSSAFPLYAPAISHDWERVLHLGVRRKFAKNELIVCGDTPCGEVMYLYSGLVRCEHPGIAGKMKICFYATKGCLFAEALAFHRLPTVASFTAAENSVVYAFSVKTIRESIIGDHPDLAFNLMQVMAYKVRLYSLHLESITLNDIPAQICRICHSMLVEVGALERSPGIGQQELADILGVHRNTIVRAVDRLKKDGVIANLSKSNLRVDDLEILRRRGIGGES